MPTEYPCVVCQSTTTLFVPGTITPREFFSQTYHYKIAAGDAHQRLPIYTCQKCGHGFTPLDIPPDLIVSWYQQNPPDHTFLADETARRRTARTVLQKIESICAQPGRLLDVGAGPGIFVSEARARGWEATGVDPSQWAVQHGRQAYGVPLVQGDIMQLRNVATRPYDVVTLFDVIEHVPDPRELVQAAVAALRPHGLLVLTTPRFDSVLAALMGKRWYCIFPAHLHYFTRSSLQHTLRAAGFEVVAARAHTRYLGAQYVWQRLTSFLFPHRPAPSAGQRSSISIPLNFGDEFEVYAKKR